MNVFLFPGQGSQEVGMAADLFKSDAVFRDLVRRASERTGADLERICLRGPERELVRTRFLQPLLVCVSLGYLRRLTEAGVQPDLVLGHSLGEITALAAAGVVPFESAVGIAARRGELMEARAALVPGGMVAVIGSGRDLLLRVLADTESAGRVVLANDNAPDQILISGELPALQRVSRFIAGQKLGRCRPIPVAGAWHSPLMAAAREEFEHWLAGVEFCPPRIPLLLNVTATWESDPDTLRRLVARNLVEPVRWRDCMAQVKAGGPATLFEIGPGRVLSGLARANGLGGETRVCCVNNPRGVELASGTTMNCESK